ncbi:NapC/NirT family cytochrome c [bacterium AH-315-I18]|nr:NapC/NirT family cytochrome c [Phycisphaeraceae bacterium]MBN4061014.1 NapC/NirT family cytochrome c [bacterium AH-315-I18]
MDSKLNTPSDTPKTQATRPKWQRLLGIRRRPGCRIPITLTLWGVVLLGGICGVVGMIGFVEYSMQPDFCRSCHIMEPYYQAWHQSSHNKISCVKCHFEPGLANTIYGKFQASSQAVKYITKTYGSKPHAEVQDAACMREGCHTERLLKGKVNWDVKSSRDDIVTIRFDHTPHLTQDRRGKQLRCVSCHSQIVQGKHLVVTLDTCFLCHFKGFEHGREDNTLGGCRSCHDAPKEQIRMSTGMFKHADYIDRGVSCQNCHSDAISGDGAVPRQVCWTCHNQPSQIARFSETSLMHKAHVNEHKVECSSCHAQIIHNLAASSPTGGQRIIGNSKQVVMKAGTCAQCHEQLHSGALDLYRGTGGRGVPDMPSVMFRTQVDCIACHDFPEHANDIAQVSGQTFQAKQAACTKCHGQQYNDKLAQWLVAIEQNLTQAQEVVKQTAQLLKQISHMPATQQLELRQLYDDAQHNVKLVRIGRGVHNMTYAIALLHVAIDNCKTIQEAVDLKEPAS